ncbi:MAG: tetratricopeptide repeat protein [Myxococcota bacterium]
MIRWPNFVMFAALSIGSVAVAQDDAGAGAGPVDSETTGADAATAEEKADEAPPAEPVDPDAVVDGREGVDAVAFRGTVNRFIERMQEFDREAQNIIQNREREERQLLNKGYEGPLVELKTEEEALRDTAIGRLENFLVRYPASSHAPHAMFLLGDLYYEDSEEYFMDASMAYERLDTSEMDMASIPEPPMRDHERALRMFRGIADAFPEYKSADGSWYMLGYIYHRDETVQANELAGRDAYLALVDQYPKSEFAPAAHMALGEYYFDNHQIDKAIANYSRVVELHAPDGKHYEKGLYKLAWSHYKLSSYERCLDLLAKLLDWSDENFQKTGKDSAMEPEAIEYTAISFSDMADNTGGDPITVAQRFYRRIGQRSYEDKVYERLADVLMQQARYAEAIATYDYMIKRWPNEPKNPTYMWTVARLYRSLDVPDLEASQNSITRLNELFNRDSAWANANRNNPDALDVADGYIEESLASVAIDLHNAAGAENNLAKFSRAADLYSQYLNKFPFAKDYYEIQWYFADTLLKSGRLPEAAAEYTQLLKGTGHPYRDGSTWNLMQVRRQILLDKYGKVEVLPPDAVQEKVVTAESGNTRAVYFVSDEHKQFIDVADMLLEVEFTNEEYKASLDAARPAMAYLPGQILYYHGHLEAARERLHKVIERWPEKDEAAYAASLIVDSWSEEENLAKVRMWAGKFARMRLGSSDEALAKNLNFTNLEEGAAFKMAATYIEQGKREEAAEAFLSFMNDFPKSEYVKKAHYNAANNFEIIGQVDRANQLFRDYIGRIESGAYAADDQAWPIYERIAHNYASSLQLEDAVRYFEMLYQRSAKAEKPYESAPAALYNAGFLRIGLGDHSGAAQNLERYASENRDQADAEKVMWSAADQWELVDSASANAYYERYLAAWGDSNPDHVIAARYRMAVNADKSGDLNANKRWDELIETYNTLAPTGEIGPLGIHYAAGAAFRPIQAKFEEFRQYEFVEGDDGYNSDLINENKKPALYALEAQCVDFINSYPDFDYSSAALYTLGAAYLTFAQMLFEVPEPEGFDDEMLDMYLTALDDLRIPVEDKGKSRLIAALDKAKKEKRWSEWTGKTMDFLAQKFPTEFAKESPEIRGEGDSTLLPMAGPMSPRGVVTEGEEESAEQSPAVEVPAPEAPPSPPVAPTKPAENEQGVW